MLVDCPSSNCVKDHTNIKEYGCLGPCSQFWTCVVSYYKDRPSCYHQEEREEKLVCRGVCSLFNSNDSQLFLCTVVSFQTDEKESHLCRWEMLIMLIVFCIVSGDY